DMLPMRAVSYFLNTVNYGAAGGGIALFLRNRKGVPFLEAFSSFLFLNFIDFLVLAVIIGMGLAFGAGVDPAMRRTLWAIIAALSAILLGTLIYWNLKFDFFFLGRLRTWPIFSAFARARLKDYAILALLRLLLFGEYTVFEALFLKLFQI